MRSRIALVATAVLLGGLLVYATRPNAGPTAEIPAPTATATPSAIGSPTVAASPSPLPSPPVEVNTIEVKAHVVSVPRDFRYVVTGSRLLVLDLGAGTTIEAASFTSARTEPGFPRADVVASENGSSVLLTVYATQQDAGAYLLTPETGRASAFVHGALVRAALSRDGRRVAVGRNDRDPALTGLWVGTTSGGPMRRLIADDPQYSGSPPLPYGFSPSGNLLSFGLANGESGAHAGIVSFSSEQGTADRGSGGWAIKGSDAILLGPSSGAEFVSDDELFVWSSRTMIGGQTVAYTYKIAAKTTHELFRPTGDVTIANAAWAPVARGFALGERPMCCGASLALTVRTIAEDGTVRQLGEWSVIDMWWSGSGSAAKLYGILGLDDSTGSVVEMIANKAVMQFCWRGGAPGSCT